MGSRSRPAKRAGVRTKRKKSDADIAFEAATHWQRVLTAIENSEKGVALSWSERAKLYTQFRGQLHRYCKQWGLGCSDGYEEAIKRLVEGSRLEFFDRDAIKKLKKHIRSIIGEAQHLRQIAAVEDVI